MDTKSKSHLTHLEVAILVAHEAVSLLDDRMLDTVDEFRTALETLCTVHDLGEDGGTLLDWVDSEIENEATGRFTDLPHLIHPDNLELVPHAGAQMDAAWELFEAAAMEECDSGLRKILLDTARTLTQRNGLDELIQTAERHDMMLDAGTLQEELYDVRENLALVQAMTLPSEPAM